MTLETWERQRGYAFACFWGKATMIGKQLENGVYTAQDAARELRNADAELTRQFADIDKAWEKSMEAAS